MWQFIQKQLLPQMTAAQQSHPCSQTLTPPSQDLAATPHAPQPIIVDNNPNADTHQTHLRSDATNIEWGDCDQYNSPHNFFRVLSKNVSTLNPQSLDMTAIAVELHNVNASIFVAQETNTAWKPTTTMAIQTQCHRVQQHHKIAFSSSQDGNKATYQPGGTLTLALGKWASRVIGHSQDEMLGRWSYLEMVGQGGMRLMVVSAYRPCPQQFDAPVNTVTAQQTRLLLQHGVVNPQPRQQFIVDLIKQVKEWQ